MDAQEKEIEYYETEDGKQPFRGWLFSLKDINGRQKIKARINRRRYGKK
jgi:putative component of toxin-antitoxin plasmid stabilization module